MTKKYLTTVIIIVATLTGQIKPPKDLHAHPPRTWVLIHGHLHISPEVQIPDGTIIIRNGIIEEAGESVSIPDGGTVIDLNGAHVYAGFIDSWLDVHTTQKDSSLRKHWNSNMRARVKVVDIFKPKKEEINTLRKAGFTTAHIVPKGGIFEGQSALIQLENTPLILQPSIAQSIAFRSGGWSSKEYPTSLLGTIAFIRQGFYDATWYGSSMEILKKYPQKNEPIVQNISLEILSIFMEKNYPIVFRTTNDIFNLRAKSISLEFGLNFWVKGNGKEYRRLKEIAKANPFIILPINFPGKPNVEHPHEALQYSTEQLKHWDMAPDNPHQLVQAGISFSLTASDLKDKSRFQSYLARAVERGLSEKDALAALTTTPAEKFGEFDRLGKISPGFIANLTVVDGNYFEKNSTIQSVWINGNEIKINPIPNINPVGSWTLNETNTFWNLSIRKKQSRFSGELKQDSIAVPIDSIHLEQDRIYWVVRSDSLFQKGFVRFSGTMTDSSARGIMVYPDGNEQIWTAQKDSSDIKRKEPTKRIENQSILSLTYPEGAFGWDAPLPNPKRVLVNDATIWTCGHKGILKNWDLLIENGRIKKIARNISMPKGGALFIEGRGKHITPGLLDAHSHMAAASINEGFQSVTSEVRMQDVVEPDDIAMYRALAGGLTTINLLHGSANPIGGQNAVLKLRWGKREPENLIFKRAPQGIKFALGENVKRSNWNDPTNRYPKTRMGVEQIIRDAFQAAVEYKKTWNVYHKNSQRQKTKIPPRHDLELEALVEILEGKRLIHCHSYRQDEILMLTRIAEDFGFTIGTFQHVLEGYKVAERLLEHGAGASTFSDWWAYKYEVIDAIPFNGALMTEVGVNVSFNSDSDELARRMNLEAAKAVKYGGLSEEEALHLVTINPAKQLKINDWVGSLEPGKDADFVIWSGHPLSTFSKCEQTWIEGIQYFSLEQDKYYRQRDEKLRNDLIQKILSSTEKSGEPLQPNGSLGQKYHSCSLSESFIQKRGN